jgi:hypothetical protein
MTSLPENDNLPPAPLRSCAGCTGSFLGHLPSYPDEPYFCPKCSPRYLGRKPFGTGDLVRRLGHWGAFSRFVVLELWPEELVLLQPLGFPSQRVIAHAQELTKDGP